MLVGELDENIFEAGSERANFGYRDAIFEEFLAELVQIEMVVDERVDGLAENRGAANDSGAGERNAARA